MSLLVIFLSALIPMLIGFIWYNPKLLGQAWMNAAGLTEEKMKNANMALVFGLTFVFSLMLVLFMKMVVVHQGHIDSLFYKQTIDDPNSEAGAMYQTIKAYVGDNFRTFKHGCFHGTIAGFFMAFPVIGITALFERKGFKYIAINVGYWIITLGLMGGVICAFV